MNHEPHQNTANSRSLRKGDIVSTQDGTLHIVITPETCDGWVNLASGLGEYAKDLVLICKAENREA